MTRKIHEEPLSYDLISEEEKEQLTVQDELARMEASQRGEWGELTREELDNLERPDNSTMLDDWYRDPLWSEVLPNLWQGGTSGDDEMHFGRAKESARITPEQFDTVITMYASAQPVQWQVKEFRFGVYDANMNDFDPTELFDIVRAAHREWAKGKKVLIRCQAGWNRSGLVMALVMLRAGGKMEDIIALIREKRSAHALCNKHFVTFLLKQNAQDWQGDDYGQAPAIDIKN